MGSFKHRQLARLFGFEWRYILVSLTFWLVGFVCTFALYTVNGQAHPPTAGQPFNLNRVTLFHSDNVFLFILTNNLVVALLLSLGGLFTGGLLTLVFNVWNGVFFGLLFQVTLHYMPAKLWIVWIHGPAELVGFALVSAFGLEGFANIQQLVKNEPLSVDLSKASLLRLWIPAGLLVLAAFLEALTTKIE